MIVLIAAVLAVALLSPWLIEEGRDWYGFHFGEDADDADRD